MDVPAIVTRGEPGKTSVSTAEDFRLLAMAGSGDCPCTTGPGAAMIRPPPSGRRCTETAVGAALPPCNCTREPGGTTVGDGDGDGDGDNAGDGDGDRAVAAALDGC
jgi:hypothetical protein